MTREKAILVEEVTNLPLAVDLGNGTAALRIVGTIADGANSTLGSKTDAKSIATDATPVSGMQVLKQISSSVQAPVQQRIIRTYKATVTLGANQNPYSAGDVILDAGGVLGVWDMSASPIKTSATILGLRVQTTDTTGLTSKNLRFHIYNDSVTPIADNAPFVISDVNEGKREGAIQVTIGSGNMAKVGRTDYENLNLQPVGGKIYFVLEDVDGHTPSANSTVLYCYLKVELGN